MSDFISDNQHPWGYWLNGETFIEIPKLPMIRAGLMTPPFDVVRPDGITLSIVEKQEDAE